MVRHAPPATKSANIQSSHTISGYWIGHKFKAHRMQNHQVQATYVRTYTHACTPSLLNQYYLHHQHVSECMSRMKTLIFYLASGQKYFISQICKNQHQPNILESCHRLLCSWIISICGVDA